MKNKVYIDNLKKFEPKSKAMLAVISNIEILGFISNESNNKPIMLLISKKKIFVFDSSSKDVITEVYSLDKVKELTFVDESKRRGSLFLKLDNDKNYNIENVKKEEIILFKDLFDELKSSFVNKKEGSLSKNIDIIENYDDYDLLKSIQDFQNIKGSTLNSKQIENESNKNMNQIKSKRIVDDTIVGNDTTFSSNYIYSLLSKKNTLLPDGKLSSIDKLNSKIDEIDINSFKTNDKSSDSIFVSDIRQVLLKMNEKVNLLKDNIENTVNKKVSLTDIKIDEVAASSVDAKEIIKIKHSIQDIKQGVEKELKDFVKVTNEKMSKISESLVNDEILKKVDDKIFKTNEGFQKDVIQVKKDLKEKMYLISELAGKQIDLSKDLKKYSSNNDNFEDEIYTTQKAWLENNKRFSILDKKMEKLESLWKDQTNSINEIIDRLKNRGGKDSIDSSSSVNSEWFLDTIHSTSNKLLAVNKKGKGIYFDVDDFKQDIDKVIQQSKNELNVMVDNKIHDLKKFLISNIEEAEQSKDEKIIENLIPKKEFEIILFKAKGYILNNTERFGIRSGQTLSLKMDKNTPGIDNFYFSDLTKEPLFINKFDGIIFGNKKYYFKIPQEFKIEKIFSCKINHIDYFEGTKPYRGYEINIGNDLIEYKVFDESGLLINESSNLCSKYDLKWLTFFKE